MKSGPKLCIIQGVQKIVLRETKDLILNEFHLLPTSGHAGMNRMYNNIRKYYFWPGLRSDVEDYVKSCHNCQKYKYSVPIKEKMCITTTAASAFEKIFLDIVGPFEKGNDDFVYVLTLQCELTKFVEAYPLKNKKSVSVARSFVENFILRYGVPKIIATDKGKEFMSSVMSETCKLLEISKINSTSYHHESLGALENSHKNLGAFLRMQVAEYPDSWSTWLPYWCFSFNQTVHTETKYSPFELVFGKKCRIPSQLGNTIDPIYNFGSYPTELKFRLQQAWHDARHNLLTSKLNRKIKYDEKARPADYKPNDLVLIRNYSKNKLGKIFKGPYKIIKIKDPNIIIEINKKEYEIHKNRTKPFYN